MLNAFFLPSPQFVTTVSLYQILTGFLVSFLIGLILQPCIIALRLWLRYRGVSGEYSVQRIHGDGRTENRDGEIRIKFKWWRGSYAVAALHANRAPQWKGEMHLSLDMSNVGSGVYWNVDETAGVGDQKFRYSPARKEFQVEGVTFKAGRADPFFHRWTKK